MPRAMLLAVGAFAIGTGNFVYVGVLEMLARDLGVSIASAGQLATVFALTYSLTAPLVVATTTRFPRRRVLFISLALFAGANLAMAVVPNFAGLLALRAVAALGAAAYMPVAMGAAVTLNAPGRAGRAMATVLGGLTVAFLAGIPAGTWIGTAFGWRASFGFAALLGGLALAAVSLLPALPGGPAKGLRALAIFGRPRVAANVAITLCAFVAAFTVNGYIGPVLARAGGLGGAGVGAMQVLLGVGSVLGVPLGGWIADRRPTLGMIALVLTAIAVAQPAYSVVMLVPGFSGTPGAVVACGVAMLVASAALFALGPVIQQRLIAAAAGERDVVLSLNASALFLGQGLGAGVGGLASRWVSLTANGIVGGAIALATLGALLAVIAGRRGRLPFVARQRIR